MKIIDVVLIKEKKLVVEMAESENYKFYWK